MKLTQNGKRYDTERCEILGKHDHYSHSNNYSGTTYLLRAKDGRLLNYTDSNGQDCHLTDDLILVDDLGGADWKMTEEQEKRCVELKLIEIV